MSKYNTLWEYIKKSDEPSTMLTFAEIHNILGFEMDHSFLNYKKELLEYGYKIGNISLKEQTVVFNKKK